MGRWRRWWCGSHVRPGAYGSYARPGGDGSTHGGGGRALGHCRRWFLGDARWCGVGWCAGFRGFHGARAGGMGASGLEGRLVGWTAV